MVAAVTIFGDSDRDQAPVFFGSVTFSVIISAVISVGDDMADIIITQEIVISNEIRIMPWPYGYGLSCFFKWFQLRVGSNATQVFPIDEKETRR